MSKGTLEQPLRGIVMAVPQPFALEASPLREKHLYFKVSVTTSVTVNVKHQSNRSNNRQCICLCNRKVLSQRNCTNNQSLRQVQVSCRISAATIRFAPESSSRCDLWSFFSQRRTIVLSQRFADYTYGYFETRALRSCLCTK